MLLSCINQYCFVSVLNCFIVNKKGGNKKKVMFCDYLMITLVLVYR